MVPMGENLVETGQLPGADPRGSAASTGVVHHPGNRYSALILRMASSAIILDRANFEPVCVLHMPEGSPGNLPIQKPSTEKQRWNGLGNSPTQAGSLTKAIFLHRRGSACEASNTAMLFCW